MKKNIVFSTLLATLMMPGVVMAACTINSGPGSGSITFGTVTVQRDASVGAVLASTSISSSGTNWNCSAIWTTTGILTQFTTPSPVETGVYSTNIPGVGLRITFGGAVGGNFPFSLQRNPGAYYMGGTVTAYLVKTSAGAVGSGFLTNGLIAKTAADGLVTYNLNLTGTNKIVPAACSVTNTAITVPMGNVPRESFTGIGHQSDPVPFNIALNCDAGTSVKMTIDATADSSGVPGTIALSSAGSAGVASGVAIELTHSGTPVNFGTLMPILTSTGGALYIPLIARYYQTLPTVTAGNANAQATFTMTYN